MESPLSSIQSKIKRIKGKMFKNADPYSFVCPSAYDTAWLAMIPDPHKPSQPMFKICLDWLLNNQHGEGFWGECDAFGKPTVESFPATLASMISLKKWNTGPLTVEKGLAFIHANAEKLLEDVKDHCPRWLAIVLPAMVELAEKADLEVCFPETVKETVSYMFSCQENIVFTQELVGKHCFPPLLSYLEALPPSCAVNEEDIFSNLSDDGSLFQSPSATAKAFMATGKQECLVYLQSLVQRFPNGVPERYPMDEDLIKLCMINQIQRLGLAEHFDSEIQEILAQVYRKYMEQKSWVKPNNMIATQLYKDSLAFQLLRMNGYKVSPLSLCWFLHHDEILTQVEHNFEYFTSAMLEVYRATNLMFCGEYELEEVRYFSRKLLEKTVSAAKGDLSLVKSSKFGKMIEHELNLPWFSRLDYLEHRVWIEEIEANALWEGKASNNRISYYHNKELLQLAIQNYEFRQSIYKNELEELKRWCKEWGLSNMGFGREKTTYCYFAVASATSFPHDSYIRMIVAKSAIIITVADDFFDMEGSLCELERLTDAVKRWDCRGLSSHSKVIFDALDDLVSETVGKYLLQEGTDITHCLQDLWYETFLSWLVEARWSRNGHIPSTDDYLKNGMISIANHTVVLPACCFLKPSLPNEKLRPAQYEAITKLLMVISRLLNDIQSYEKEKEEGKMNFLGILLENPESDIEDSIAFVREIIGKKKKEFLEHVLIDGHSDFPKHIKHFHLSCLKVFHMFYNSSNRYDSNTELLQDINKAIYLPLSRNSKSKALSLRSGPKKKCTTMNLNLSWPFKQVSYLTSSNGYGMVPMAMAPKVMLRFI